MSSCHCGLNWLLIRISLGHVVVRVSTHSACHHHRSTALIHASSGHFTLSQICACTVLVCGNSTIPACSSVSHHLPTPPSLKQDPSSRLTCQLVVGYFLLFCLSSFPLSFIPSTFTFSFTTGFPPSVSFHCCLLPPCLSLSHPAVWWVCSWFSEAWVKH